MNFESFAGNPEAKAQLSAAVDGGHFPHALLLEGPAGSGKRMLAALLAKAAVCVAPAGEKPCGACSGCLKAAAGAHPDIRTEGGDGAARSFHIDTVRELRDSAYVLPNEAPRRVMILAEAQGMTEQAQNALLKILEEPPAHAVFLLTCENRASMLPTILSRVQCVSLGPVPEEEALPILKPRLPDQGEEALRRSFRLFGGIIGRTLQGLEDGTFQRVLELAPRLAEAVCAPDELTLLRATAPLEKDKAAVDGVLGAVRLIFRDALMRRCAGDAPEGAVASLSVSPETADKLAAALTRSQLMALMREAEGLQAALLRNMNHTLLLTLICARFRAAAGR